MKVTPRFMIRAALVLSAGGALGAFGACKDNSAGPNPPPPPPPPPLPAPSALSAVASGTTQINLTWTDNATNESGFRLDRCSGAGCTNFAQVGTDLAANTVTFSDVGLTANTAYSYRIRAFNATDTSSWSATASATTGIQASASFIMVGAGEITNCATTASLATAELIKGMLSDTNVTVFTAGNNLADTIPGSTYADCFATKKWADFKNRTYYAIGNGDYDGGRGPDGVYGYLGDRTGPPHKGWFSFDKGTWHIVVLNTADWEQGNVALQDPNGEMNMWLAADLAATTKRCIMAISWDRRVYTTSSGTLGLQFNVKQAANILYNHGADILVSAKDKIYARFPQTNADGVKDANGFRQFIVGTGGRSFDRAITPAGANPSPVEVQQGGSSANWGVVKFTLDSASYNWEFIPTVPGGFTDSGTTACH